MTIALSKLKLSEHSGYKWWAFAALAIGTFTSVADNGSVIVTLPSIAEHFRTDLPTTQWVVTGYALAISALLLPMGRLSDIIGRKRVYLMGFAIFVLGAALSASSPNILVLIGFKVLQGVGAAMTQGTSMAMILSTFSPQERGKALGLQMSLVGSGNIAGPALGGLVAGLLGWQWVFYMAAIFGVLSILPALVVLDGRLYSRQAGARPAFDWPGAVLSTAVMVIFLLGVTNGGRLGWISPAALGTFASVAVLGPAFVWWELRSATPMMDVRLFRRRLFSMGVTASFLAFIGMSSVRFLTPFYLQAVRGFTPGQVGLTIMPSAAAMMVMGPLAGRLSDRYGWSKFTAGGLVICACALLLLSTTGQSTPLWLVVLGIILQSAGMGTFNAPNNSSVLSTVEQSRYGVMSGFLNLVRNSGNVTGVTFATAVVTIVMASMGFPPTLAAVSESGGEDILQAFMEGLRTAYRAFAVLVLIGAALSLVKGDRAAGATPAQAEASPGAGGKATR